MKFGFPKDKNGNVIKVATLDTKIFDENGKSVADKIRGIESRVNYMYKSIEYLEDAVIQLENGGSSSNNNPFKDVALRSDSTQNICLLSDNKGVVTSEYGYDYDKLAGMLYTGEFSEYIKDGDWIELTTNDGATYKMYANIDTYYGEGEDDAHKIGHHIDFISDNLIYGSTSTTNGKVIYSSTDRRSWRLNYDTTYSTEGNNNGVSTESSPFLANSTTHRGVEGGIIDKLNDYYVNNIPDGLKNYIVKKYHKVPTRYQSGTGLNDDNGSKWTEMPYLWIPYEREVHGTNKYAASTYESHMKQYHSFANISNFKVKGDKKDTSSSWIWWTASAFSGSTSNFCRVNRDGSTDFTVAYNWNFGVPLCFRFNASPYEDKSAFDPFADVTLRTNTGSNICLLTDNNGVITSDYGYTYEKLSGILQSGNYSDYIKDGDYITLITNDGATYKMYANIDTYYGTGETGKEIGHHIDFISDNLIYGSTSRTNGNYIYSSTDRRSWRMNKDTTYYEHGSNNGVSTETSPFLANSTTHRGLQGGIIDKLNDYYVNNIPDGLKNYIVKKYHKVPTRYQSGTGLTADNSSKWAEMPYLWIPYEKEVYGSNTAATTTYESHMKQYHSFANISSFKKKGDKKDTTSSYFWWTASAYSGHTYDFCLVNNNGSAYIDHADGRSYGCPLCFRFQ